jgi:Domain of unknown function (DUF4296)
MSNLRPPKERFYMRASGVVLILILCTIVSCERDSEPEGVLTKPQMVDWMLDLYMGEARAQLFNTSRDSAYKLFLPYQDSLKHRQGITDSVLTKTYRYYLEHPAKMEAIYDVVIDSLSLREQKLLK